MSGPISTIESGHWGSSRGQPILIDPAGRIDPRLVMFFRRSRFARHADTTRRSYATDYRLFFTFLWQRGKNWDEADHEDLEDYEAWRRRSEDNPCRIGGAKWGRELAAFKSFYDWAAGIGHLDRSPVLTHVIGLRDGTVAEAVDQRPKNVRSSNVKWLTPRTFRLWRDVGLRGYGGDGLRDRKWRGRNETRNAAFADTYIRSKGRNHSVICKTVPATRATNTRKRAKQLARASRLSPR